MLNIFNGPPVSFNRDGGPSLAYAGRGLVSGTVPASNYGRIEIHSQGRPFYLTAVSGDSLAYVYLQRNAALLSPVTSRTEVVGTSNNQFGSVDTTSKTYVGWGTAAQSADADAADAWIGFDAQAPLMKSFNVPIFCPANEVLALVYSEAATAFDLSLWWVEIFSE